ncbi:M1 family metallopeptidase [Mesobacillus maritimus]|uniref:M1 family metallopeptidase n=1 Tax=Mesobacillus maritimus TaxID=1643336 RepID=UPI002040E124|nr:M1 family metallopeptidase [Mesobacillus maritimus]
MDSTVVIKNTSKDNLEELVFYFIPNIFTDRTAQELNYPVESPAKVQFYKVAIEGEQMDFTLEKDTLRVPLNNKLKPDKEVSVDFSYDFTVPENGLRFTKSNGNYFLSQFYPMVATYRDHKWNKEDYRVRGETYHTAFSNFKVSYDLPDGYTIASTSDDDTFPSGIKGNFEVSNTKDVFIAILKNPSVTQKVNDAVEIRIFGFEDKKELYSEISEVASDAFSYFEKTIGPYPFKQLDIVIDSLGMEYPGIITANTIYGSGPVNPDALKNVIVHEIAHQWFYGIISNDPYHDAWLDEGFASFATGLYEISKSKEEIPYEAMNEQLAHLEPLPVNLPLDKYEKNQSSYIYGKSSTMLFKLFEERGGIKEAEKFLESYYELYKYKEVNTEEFVRFTKHYFNLKDNSTFEEWLLLE